MSQQEGGEQKRVGVTDMSSEREAVYLFIFLISSTPL